jgi:hypothetical protein
MPKQLQLSSTVCCYRLYKFIETFGKVIVKKCSTCVKHSQVCKVYVCLGKCSKCLYHRQCCNVKVTKLEFKRLAAEKEKLQVKIKES